MELFQTSAIIFALTIVVSYLPSEINTATVISNATALTGKSGNSSVSNGVPDSDPAGSGKKYTIGMEDDDLDGFSNTYGKKGKDGYNNKNKYHKRDGDSYGFSTHGGYNVGDDDGVGGAYHQSYSYDSDKDKSGKTKPQYKEWHYEKKKGQPARRSYYTTGKEASGKNGIS
ncbi:hypothetical protein WDU94_011258 [Cyamophila willieti]